MTAPRKRVTKSPKTQAVDCRHHLLTVFDGADRVGSLVERAGKFDAFDMDGRMIGTFPDLRTAARVMPPGREAS